MINIAKIYRHWSEEICNAFIEGKNRLCKEIKALWCGYNNFAIYKARILYISVNKALAFNTNTNISKRKIYKKTKKKRVRLNILHPRIFYRIFYLLLSLKRFFCLQSEICI